MINQNLRDLFPQVTFEDTRKVARLAASFLETKRNLAMTVSYDGVHFFDSRGEYITGAQAVYLPELARILGDSEKPHVRFLAEKIDNAIACSL